MLGLLLAAPFIATPAIIQSAISVSSSTPALIVLCLTFAASWLAALSIAMTGSSRGAEWAGLALASLGAAALVVTSGGLSAAAMVLLAAIAIETWWVTGSPRSAGIAAAIGLAVVGTAATLTVSGTGASATLLEWLSPALYAASWVARKLEADHDSMRPSTFGPVSIPESALDAVVVRMNAVGETESVSAQARDILRLDPELLLGSGLFERVHVGDRVAMLCAVADTRDDGAPRRCSVRLRLPVMAGGEGRGYRAFEIEILKDDPQSRNVVGVIRDVSDVESLRNELECAREQANAIDLAKSRFLAAVSHELRTPLNAIIGFSDMLLHREISGDLTAKQSENIALIREAGNHLLSVVNAILDVSKIESGSYHINVEPFALRPAVDLCNAMLEPQAAEKRVTLSVNLPGELKDVAGDQRAVQQILLNLVSNAIKFTPEGGQVSVSAAQKGDTIRIFVHDNGIGIAADDLNQLGRPFMQVQNDYTRQFQGTGLGLSLVKGLVTLHGGTMSIESAPGLGTTVTVGLPAAALSENDSSKDSEAAQVAGDEAGERHGIALRKIA